MATATPTRRGLLGAIAVAPAMLAAASASAMPITPADPVWPKLVADFRAKYSAWLVTTSLDDDAMEAFQEACSSLPSEPSKPPFEPGVLTSMTIGEIRALTEAPENVIAWCNYARDHAAWKKRRDALRLQFIGPAKAAYDGAYAAYATAFRTLTEYRVASLTDLAEKIEIIAADYEGSDIPPEYMADVLADVRHLAGGA